MPKHGPETQQEVLSRQPPAAASSPRYAAVVARLCPTLGRLVSIVFITLTALALWLCSPAPGPLTSRSQQCPPATPPPKIGFKESLLSFTSSDHPVTSQSKQPSPTAPRWRWGNLRSLSGFFYSRENRLSYQRTETASVELMNPAPRAAEEGTGGAACPETGRTRNPINCR